MQRAELDISRLDDPYVRELRTQLGETGRKLWVLDITHDLGIPSFVALSHSKENGEDFVEFGSGSHFDARIALLRALTELNQFLSIGLMGMRDQGSLSEDGTSPWRLEDHPYLIPNGRPSVQADFSSKFGVLDKREQVMACVNLVKREGLDFLVLDQTRPDIEVPVARVIVPGFGISIAASHPAGFTTCPSSWDGLTGPCRRAISIRCIPKPEAPIVRAPRKNSLRRSPPAIVSAGLNGHVTIEPRAAGDIVARFNGISLALGQFSSAAVERARELNTGLPLAALASPRKTDKEVDLLVRRLAARGLLEFRLVRPALGRGRNDQDLVIIEPQAADYWPRMAQLRDTDALALSRFAYLRRRANDIVLKSPRARALFRICDPTIAAALATLAAPQQIRQLRRVDGFPAVELLALLLDCEILFKTRAKGGSLRTAEGDENLVLWDFHDLLFHARSTEGRHANPLGGRPYAEAIAPLQAVRPSWPGEEIDLRKVPSPPVEAKQQAASLLRQRHSARDFDAQRPITLGELAHFLDSTARVQSVFTGPSGDGEPPLTFAPRPYPSGGGSYELELYLAVDTCEGLARGLYHYDAANTR